VVPTEAIPGRQHTLSAIEAKRILSFCLPSGSRAEVAEGTGTCTIHITSSEEKDRQTRAFAGATLAEALRAAAAAGVVRPACIERQIAFISSTQPSSIAPLRSVEGRDDRQTAGPVTMPHYRGLSEFRYQIRKFVSFSERAARAAGLEPPQHQLLLSVQGLPPPKRPTIETLSERMCLDGADCESLIASLVERTLVHWTANVGDPRKRLLAITPAGSAVLRTLTELHRDQMLTVGPTFLQALGMILSSREVVESDSE